MKVAYENIWKNRLPSVSIVKKLPEYLKDYYPDEYEEAMVLIKTNKLGNEIKIIPDNDSLLKSHQCVNNSSFSADKKIRFNEVFLEYVWHMTFSTLIVWQELVHKPTEEKKIADEEYFNGKYKVQLLLKSANYHKDISLDYLGQEVKRSRSFSAADFCASPLEEYYVNLTNHIFVLACCNIFLHELCHCKEDHLGQLQQLKNDPEVDINEEKKRFEEIADQYARSSVTIDETDKEFQKCIGAIIGSSAALFFSSRTGRIDHPDSASRLRKTIDSYAKKNSELYSIGFFLLGFWDEKFKIDIIDFIN